MIIRGIDTLEFGLEIFDYRKSMNDYLERFKDLKEQGQETCVKQEIMINGINFTVEKSGAPFYAYRLTCNDFFLYFMDKTMANNSPVKVRFLSSYIWSFGFNKSYTKFMDWFKKFNLKVLETKVSRVDICADTDEARFIYGDINGLTTKAKVKELHHADDVYYTGKVFTGFTIGRGNPVLCRIYNKTIEIKRSGKVWFHELWKSNGWDDQKEVWRVEFQMRRNLLKEFNISSVEDIFEKEEGVWAYLTKEWLIIRSRSGGNVSRWKVKRKWKIIQNAINKEVTPLVREKVKQGNLYRIMDQAAGLCTTIGALGNFDNVEDTAKFIQSHAENKLRKKETTFPVEMERRRSRFY